VTKSISHAAVSREAQIGRDVRIGPYCVVEPEVVIGDRCILESRATIKRGTTLGADNHIHDGAILGGLPQHLRRPPKVGRLVIGCHNTIRENATLNRGLREGQCTTVGDHNLIMTGVHIAHDCHVGHHTIFANNVMLAGHVTVEDRAYLSGAVGAHQFCRIGRHAMVGGQAHLVKDVPPFVTLDGATSRVVGLNLIGLRRHGFSDLDIQSLKAAYRIVFRSALPWSEILERLAREFPEGPAAELHHFLLGGTRGFVHERRAGPQVTLKLRDADAEVEEMLRWKKAG